MVIMLGLWAGLGDYISNILGYGVGLIVSFILNRRWTFNVQAAIKTKEIIGFLLVFAVAFGANLLVLMCGRAIGLAGQPLLQLAAMATYSGLFFILTRQFIFHSASGSAAKEHTSLPDRMVQIAKQPRTLSVAVLAVASVTGWLAIRYIDLTHDVMWQIWISRHMTRGAELYKDIIELNPPLWFWSALPFQYLSDMSGIAMRDLLIVSVILASAMAAALVTRLVDLQRPGTNAVLALLLFSFCLFTSLYDLGQREQWAAIFALPYAVLIARRAKGTYVPCYMAVTIGFFAAYGFALKHYFAVIPVALELWLFLRMRKKWQPLRAETAMLAGAALTYAAAVIVYAKPFLTDIIPLVQTAYHGYDSVPASLIMRPWTYIWAMQLGLIGLLYSGIRAEQKFVVQTLLITAFAFMAAYFSQQKGWSYHALPVTILTSATLAMTLLISSPSLSRIMTGVAALTIGLSFLLSFSMGTYKNWFQPQSAPYYEKVARGDALLVVSADPMWAWPMVETRGLKWPSRFYAYWMLPAIAHAQVNGTMTPELEAVATMMKEDAAAAILCSAPKLILIERRPNYSYQPESFDVRGFFLSAPAFRQSISDHYTELAPADATYAYIRNSDTISGRPADCPTAWDR